MEDVTKLYMLMKVSVVKTKIVFQEKGKKDQILWAFLDEMGHTIIQVYDDEYPADMEKFILDDTRRQISKDNC